MASRGIEVTYESIRQWCRYFGQDYARKIRAKQTRFGDTWHLDEVFIKIKGKLHYLWRAVDQDGDTLDILVQSRKDTWVFWSFRSLILVLSDHLNIPARRGSFYHSG